MPPSGLVWVLGSVARLRTSPRGGFVMRTPCKPRTIAADTSHHQSGLESVLHRCARKSMRPLVWLMVLSVLAVLIFACNDGQKRPTPTGQHAASGRALLGSGATGGGGPMLARGEAMGLVKTWLARRPWTDKKISFETLPTDSQHFPSTSIDIPSPARSKVVITPIESDCLTYHEKKSAGSFVEQYLGDGLWRVSHEVEDSFGGLYLTVGRYHWTVYEKSLTINPESKPDNALC